ncbi:MAG: phosphoribosylamine--glycine ligase [Candidatus Lokiarchaeota archaeon]|nr:phosphoribosylamine--glycine ligase [Candidatus Lokiarchaeota archaeon]
MPKVIIIGHGAREHTIAEALVKGGAELYAFMSFRNAGLDELSKGRVKIEKEDNFKVLIDFIKQNGIDFAVVGPEAPLVVGIVDALEKAQIPCIGPKIEAAQLEGSKIFTRQLLDKNNIKSNIIYEIFVSMDGVEAFIKELGVENVVVKPDGLTGGKGVKVYGDHLFSKQEIIDYCQKLVKNGMYFIIEEKLEGEEFTLQALVDGNRVVGNLLVQDFKRAYNDDKGPNTGGMGSYSIEDHSLPFIDVFDINEAISEMNKVVSAVKKETGTEYKGFLYGQFMKVKKGIKLVEFNVRLGDPEAMNVLPILKDNFVDLCYKILDGNLPVKLNFEKKATVCKYLAPEGYPVNPLRDQRIIIHKEKIEEIGAKFYYASVYKKDNSVYTTTSRAIGMLGISDTLEEAEKIAEKGVSFIEGKLFHRSDVGTKKILQKRIDHMKFIQNQ